MKTVTTFRTALSIAGPSLADPPVDGSVLPFPPTPLSESLAKPRLQDATMKSPAEPQRLPADAPSILVTLTRAYGP